MPGRALTLQNVHVRSSSSACVQPRDVNFVVQVPLAPPTASLAHHPPAWDTHMFGPAYGNCNRGVCRLPSQKEKAIHVGNGALFPLRDHAAKPHSPPPYKRIELDHAQDVCKLEEARISK